MALPGIDQSPGSSQNVSDIEDTLDQAVSDTEETYDQAVSDTEETYYQAVSDTEETLDQAVSDTEDNLEQGGSDTEDNLDQAASDANIETREEIIKDAFGAVVDLTGTRRDRQLDEVEDDNGDDLITQSGIPDDDGHRVIIDLNLPRYNPLEEYSAPEDFRTSRRTPSLPSQDAVSVSSSSSGSAKSRLIRAKISTSVHDSDGSLRLQNFTAGVHVDSYTGGDSRAPQSASDLLEQLEEAADEDGTVLLDSDENATSRVPYEEKGWRSFVNPPANVRMEIHQGTGYLYHLRQTINDGSYLQIYHEQELKLTQRVSDETVPSAICIDKEYIYLYDTQRITAFDLRFLLPKSSVEHQHQALDIVSDQGSLLVLRDDFYIDEYRQGKLTRTGTLEKRSNIDKPVYAARMKVDEDGHIMILSACINDVDDPSSDNARAELILTIAKRDTGEQLLQTTILRLDNVEKPYRLSFIALKSKRVMILYNYQLHYTCYPYESEQTVSLRDHQKFDGIMFRESDRTWLFHDVHHVVHEIPMNGLLLRDNTLNTEPDSTITCKMSRSEYFRVVALSTNHVTGDLCLVNGTSEVHGYRPEKKRIIWRLDLSFESQGVNLIKMADKNSILVSTPQKMAKFDEEGTPLWDKVSKNSIKDIMYDPVDDYIYCLTDKDLLVLDINGSEKADVALPGDVHEFNGIGISATDRRLILSSAVGGCMFALTDGQWLKFGEECLNRPTKLVVDDQGSVIVIDGEDLVIIDPSLEHNVTKKGPFPGHNIESVALSVGTVAVNAGFRCFLLDENIQQTSNAQ